MPLPPAGPNHPECCFSVVKMVAVEGGLLETLLLPRVFAKRFEMLQVGGQYKVSAQLKGLFISLLESSFRDGLVPSCDSPTSGAGVRGVLCPITPVTEAAVTKKCWAGNPLVPGLRLALVSEANQKARVSV